MKCTDTAVTHIFIADEQYFTKRCVAMYWASVTDEFSPKSKKALLMLSFLKQKNLLDEPICCWKHTVKTRKKTFHFEFSSSV